MSRDYFCQFKSLFYFTKFEGGGGGGDGVSNK
jgi:hypothetical protein